MGTSPSQFVALQRCPATSAGLPVASVDPGLAAVISVDALDVSEITEGCSAGTNADLQYIHQTLMQDFEAA